MNKVTASLEGVPPLRTLNSPISPAHSMCCTISGHRHPRFSSLIKDLTRLFSCCVMDARPWSVFLWYLWIILMTIITSVRYIPHWHLSVGMPYEALHMNLFLPHFTLGSSPLDIGALAHSTSFLCTHPTT